MEKKARGRPRKFNNMILVSFNIEKEVLERLDVFCKDNYYDRSRLINKAVDYYIKNNNQV